MPVQVWHLSQNCPLVQRFPFLLVRFWLLLFVLPFLFVRFCLSFSVGPFLVVLSLQSFLCVHFCLSVPACLALLVRFWLSICVHSFLFVRFCLSFLSVPLCLSVSARGSVIELIQGHSPIRSPPVDPVPLAPAFQSGIRSWFLPFSTARGLGVWSLTLAFLNASRVPAVRISVTYLLHPRLFFRDLRLSLLDSAGHSSSARQAAV
jgi:hypothetical protein